MRRQRMHFLRHRRWYLRVGVTSSGSVEEFLAATQTGVKFQYAARRMMLEFICEDFWNSGGGLALKSRRLRRRGPMQCLLLDVSAVNLERLK